jgi:multisubunit Na+/H+ antiporter MnhF subunit
MKKTLTSYYTHDNIMKIQRKEVLNMLEKDNFCPHCGSDFPRGWELLMEAFEKEKSDELRVIRRECESARKIAGLTAMLISFAVFILAYSCFSSSLSFIWIFAFLAIAGMVGSWTYALYIPNSEERRLWKEFIAKHFSTLKDRDRAG